MHSTRLDKSTKAAKARRRRSRGGGGGGGKLQWESTHSVRGVRAITQFRVQEEVINDLTSEMISNGAKGYAFCLMSSWSRLADLHSDRPLLIIFPGRCSAALRKLEVSADRIKEEEIILQDGDEAALVRRKVTLLRMSEHHFSTGGGFRSIAWSPQAAVELILEIDGRWAAPAIIQEAQKCWKSLAAVSASKLALETIDIGDIFGARQIHAEPFQLWQARTRQTRELAEKLLVASGREACFIRPAQPQDLPLGGEYTIVWTKKNAEASAASLATVLASDRKSWWGIEA